jgi:Zn-dependent protease with chaperone function
LERRRFLIGIGSALATLALRDVWWSAAAETARQAEQASFPPLERERVRTQHLLKELLRVAALPPEIDVSLSVLDSSLNAFVSGGCYEQRRFAGLSLDWLQKPEVLISSEALLLDSGREELEITAVILAHEIGHLQKSLERKTSCNEEKARSAQEQRREEFDADRRGVELLNALGYDGALITKRTLKEFCNRGLSRCHAPRRAHPSLAERIRAIDAVTRASNASR